jgi:hypothetical protein
MAIAGHCGCHGYAATVPYRPGECYWCQHARSEHHHGTGSCENSPVATLVDRRWSPELSLHGAQIILPGTPASPDEVFLRVGSDAGHGRERDSVTAVPCDP